MNAPITGDSVTLVLPHGRERVPARVQSHDRGIVRLHLDREPRTPLPLLAKAQVFLEYACAEGLARRMGEIRHAGAHDVRFSYHGVQQLLRRTEALNVVFGARIVLLRSGSRDAVAFEARTMEVGAVGLTLQRLPAARVGELFEFDLVLDRAMVRGQLRVDAVLPDGRVRTRFTKLSSADRARIIRWACDQVRAA